MVPRKAPVVGFGCAMAGLPVWVAKKGHIKTQRYGQALALGGHRLITITNNQLIVGGSGRDNVWVEARGWKSVWGDTVPSFGTAIQTMKKNIYKILHCLRMAADQQRLTQQPTKNRRPQWSEVWRGGATSRSRVGNVIPLFGHA